MNLTNTTLLSLINGSTANISGSLNNFDAGALIRVAGGSVFKMTGGSLISFGAGTNTATFTNPSNIVNCGVGCSLQNVNFNGTLAPVLLKNNAVIGNLTVAPGFNAFPRPRGHQHPELHPRQRLQRPVRHGRRHQQGLPPTVTKLAVRAAEPTGGLRVRGEPG